jgi:hypothetical protein
MTGDGIRLVAMHACLGTATGLLVYAFTAHASWRAQENAAGMTAEEREEYDQAVASLGSPVWWGIGAGLVGFLLATAAELTGG